MRFLVTVFGIVGLAAIASAFIGTSTTTSANDIGNVRPAYSEKEETSPVVNSSYKVDELNIPVDQAVLLVGPIGEMDGPSDPTAHVVGELEAKAAAGKPLYLLINSPGGSVSDGALIVSAIQSSKVPVYTVCVQLCASMAFIIHQYGTKRYMVDKSIIMAHPASGGLQGTLEQMASRLHSIQKFVAKLNAPIAARAGISLKEFQALYLPELWMDSEDATTRRFNDKVVAIHFKGGNAEKNALNYTKLRSSKWINEKVKTELR